MSTESVVGYNNVVFQRNNDGKWSKGPERGGIIIKLFLKLNI